MLWSDILDTIAARAHEPDLFDLGGVEWETGVPYHDPVIVEQWLYEASLDELRKISFEEIEALGPPAVQKLTLPNFGVIPITMIDVFGVAIQPAAGDPFVPAKMVTANQYYFLSRLAPTEATVYTFISGQVRFLGNQIQLTILVEPELEDFQNDLVILPPGHDEPRIDMVHKLMLAEDFMPTNRI